MTSTASRPVALLLIIGLFAACSGPGSTPSSDPPPPTTSIAPTVETSAPPTTSSTAFRAGDTTTTTSFLPAVPAGPPLPALPDGRPATFLAVSRDFEAVEVDTATGSVVRSLGRVSDRADVESAECAACVNAVDAVWRTIDGATYLISECCEPAAGQINVLAEQDLPLTPERHPGAVAAWTAAPSPTTGDVAFAGYDLAVGNPRMPQRVVFFDDAYAGTNVAWDREAPVLWWIQVSHDGDSVGLASVDLRDGVLDVIPLEFATGWELAGLALSASGELITVRNTRGTDFELTATTMIVLSRAGELVSELEIEPGAVLGGYDRTGTHLIYTDGAGVVRWQSPDAAGILAGGYLFASW